MPRLCVRGISSQTSSDDVRVLFSKVCPVQEVYIPGPSSTGLQRDFAIVVVEGDTETIKKCAKSLNGSLWKGSKLCVELANEWYQDRLQRERQELAQSQQLQAQVFEDSTSTPVPPFVGTCIKLRKIKFQEIPSTISLVPSIKVAGKCLKRKQPKNSLPCGVRLILDQSLFDPNSFAEMEVEAESKESVLEQAAAAQSGSSDVKTASAGTTASQAPGPMAAIVQKLSTGAVQPIGGGVRKGFGSLSVPAVPAVTVPAPSADGASVVDKRSSAGWIGGSGGSVDCCVEEHEQFSSNHLLEDEEGSEDGEPCITEADLQHEALERERARALQVLEKMLAGDGPVKKDKKTLRKEAQEKKKADIAAASGEERQIVDDQVVVAAFGSEEEETQAILNELMGGGSGSGTASVPPVATTPAVVTTSESKKSAVGAPSAVSKAEKEPQQVKESAPVEEEMQTTKDGFANVNQLKNIFYREGGVWWGDDGTLTGAVARGTAAADPLFLEAEKRGIDIRSVAPKPAATATSAAAAGANGAIFNFAAPTGAAEEAPAETDNKGMTFGFFAEPESAPAVAPSVAAGDAAATASVLAVKTVTAPAITKAATVTKADTAGTGSVSLSRPVLVDLTAAELVAMARKFGREKPVDVLNSEWRDGKDKLVLDYKRKRKDMKRRTAAWSSSNLSNVFGERERPASVGAGAEGRAGNGRAAGGSGGGAHYLRGRNRGGGARKKARKV